MFKVNTTSFQTQGSISGLVASRLFDPWQWGWYTEVEGLITPEIVPSGTFDEITNISVIHYITNAQGQLVADVTVNPTPMVNQNGYIYFDSKSPINWLVLGPGYTFHATVQVWWISALTGQTGTKAFVGTFPGIHLDSSQIPNPVSVTSPLANEYVRGTYEFVSSVEWGAQYYEIEISKNGSVVYSNVQHLDNTWNINLASYGTGSFSVRVRARNADSAWCAWSAAVPFNVWAIPTLFLSASLDPRPTKPVHEVQLSGSISDAGGCTITARRLYINNNPLYVTGTNPFIAGTNFSDGPPPITYQVKAEVDFTINGQSGTVIRTGTVTYYGEDLEA